MLTLLTQETTQTGHPVRYASARSTIVYHQSRNRPTDSHGNRRQLQHTHQSLVPSRHSTINMGSWHQGVGNCSRTRPTKLPRHPNMTRRSEATWHHHRPSLGQQSSNTRQHLSRSRDRLCSIFRIESRWTLADIPYVTNNCPGSSSELVTIIHDLRCIKEQVDKQIPNRRPHTSSLDRPSGNRSWVHMSLILYRKCFNCHLWTAQGIQPKKCLMVEQRLPTSSSSSPKLYHQRREKSSPEELMLYHLDRQEGLS